MITIGDTLKEIIKNMPFIEEGLAKGIINYSALAREIKPQIENKLYKLVKEGAIIMALKRMEEKLGKEKQKKKKHFLNFLDLTVRSNLSILTFANSYTLPKKIKILQSSKSEKRDAVCIFSEGIRETTFIINSGMTKEVEKTFKDEGLILKRNNLTAITIGLPKETIFIPGIYYQILKMLAWENINIIEIFSTYTELTIVIDDKDVNRAFSTLKNLKNFS